MIEILSQVQDYPILYHISSAIARTDIHKIAQKIRFSFVTHEGNIALPNETYATEFVPISLIFKGIFALTKSEKYGML